MPAARRDPVTDQAFVEIEWGDADALPFALCLSKRIGGVLADDLAGACGNVALADHGRTAARFAALRPLPGGRVPRFALESTAPGPLTKRSKVSRASNAKPGAAAALGWGSGSKGSGSAA